MPLSTSSSNGRIPGFIWGRVWFFAIAIVLLAVFCWEVTWRSLGFTPQLVDDKRLWAAARKQVKPDSIVLIGSSRMHSDINLDTFYDITGVKPIQLAIVGTSVNSILQHFAADETFHGTLIYSVEVTRFFSQPESESKSLEFIREYEQQAWSAGIEQDLRSFFQANFVSRLPNLDFATLLIRLLHGEKPVPPPTYIRLRKDRARFIDYSKANFNLKEEREKWVGILRSAGKGKPRKSKLEFYPRLRLIDKMVARIHERGGKVIFLRLPTSGELWEMLEEAYPKKEYWDSFTAWTRAYMLHFKDFPSLSGFDCPDGSHMDYLDAIDFTKALALILADKVLVNETINSST